MRRRGTEAAVSPIVGSILLVAMTVLMTTVVATMFMGMGEVDDEVRAGVSTEYDPADQRLTLTFVASGNAEAVGVRFDGIDASGELTEVGDEIVLDFDAGEMRFTGSGSTTVPGNITVNETVSDPSPPCDGDASESESESNDEDESQDNGVYDYTYTYEYSYTYGDYDYTYTWRYEWTGEDDPNPDPQPDPPGAGGYCVDGSDLDPDPDPNPNPDPAPGDVYAGDGPSRTTVSHAVGIDGNVSNVDVTTIGRSGSSETVLFTERVER